MKAFFPRIFTPISHLVKNAAYMHEKEWRLLYLASIKDGKTKGIIHTEKGIHLETETILFNDKNAKEEIWLGPKFGNDLEKEKLKITHLFEYDGIHDYVDIKTSNVCFRG